MNEVVVDASVAVKWLVQEEYSQEAKRLLRADVVSRLKLIAPDVLAAEIGHALRRLVNRGELQTAQAEALYDALMQNNPLQLFHLDWQVGAAQTLAQTALRLGNLYTCSFYDALYIALTLDRNATFITADRRLYEKPLPLVKGQGIIWVGDVEGWVNGLSSA